MRIVLLILALLLSCSGLKAQNPNHVKALTWNIYMRPAFLFWNGQFKRAKAIGGILKEEDYDIILFQEAFGKTSRKKLRKVLGETYPFEIGPQKQRSKTNNGLWVLSKHEINGSKVIFFEDCLGFDCLSAKGAVLIEVEINGQPYQFINTHVQAGDDNPKKHKKKKYANIRTEQFAQVRTLLDSNELKKTPQFILGDLNTDKYLTLDHQGMLDTLNASDGVLPIPENGNMTKPATWHANGNDLIARKWKDHSQLLDYALQRNNNFTFKVRRYLKIYTQQWSKRRKHLSDHFAISLTILP